MKRLLFFTFCFLFVSANVFAQKFETFDVVTFKTPIGWHKQDYKDSIRLGIEDNTEGTMCLVTIFKSLPGGNDSQANFEAAWETFVEKMVTVSGKPQLQPAANENGWTAEIGMAQYERDGRAGAVTHVTVTGYGKVVNILAVINTDAYEHTLGDFLDSVTFLNLAASNAPSRTNPAPPSGTSSSKFAVAASDLPGIWRSSNSSAGSYYNAYTGNNAGMLFTSNTYEFIFRTNGTYTSTFKEAKGFIGDTRHGSETFNGKYTVSDGKMTLTNRAGGRTDTFGIHFEAVKGGRILHMIGENDVDNLFIKAK